MKFKEYYTEEELEKIKKIKEKGIGKSIRGIPNNNKEENKKWNLFTVKETIITGQTWLK